MPTDIAWRPVPYRIVGIHDGRVRRIGVADVRVTTYPVAAALGYGLIERQEYREPLTLCGDERLSFIQRAERSGPC